MKNTVVSVIVPVYNAEKYIKTCIESIINQTYKNLEIIIINDGSTDNTEKIIYEYSKKDNRIKFITQKNCGVSKARNEGVKNAMGEHIMFIDADDYAELNMVEKAVNMINKYSVSGVFFDYYIRNIERNEVTSPQILNYGVYEKNDLIKIVENMSGGLYFSSIWRAIYKTQIIKENSINFKDIKFAEDLLFNIEYIMHSNAIFISNLLLYHYCEQENSSLKKMKKDMMVFIAYINEYAKLVDKYKNSILKRLYSREMDLTCNRLLNGTRKYRRFVEYINIIKLPKEKIEINQKLFRTLKYIQERKYFLLYIYLWKSKLCNKLKRII